MSQAEFDQENWDEFVAGEQRKLYASRTAGHGMTPLAGSVAYFRNLPYPCTPEREREVERLGRQDRAQAIQEHRRMRIAFAQACLDGVHGKEHKEAADRFFGETPAEEVGTEYLWDFWRRVAWAKAKARGETVPSKLRPLEECLKNHRARRLADESRDAIESQQRDPLDGAPSLEELRQRREPEQQTIGDWARDAYG